ncbi:acyl-coenzyme A thioesterase-like protein, partial [Trifolium medium]|nr:acyl-coenzyme A thioesterase-like protein [Trifolium medium]
TTRPLILVTASVDKIVLKKPISVNIDLTIVGSVIWVGRSSIEIQLEVTQSKQGFKIIESREDQSLVGPVVIGAGLGREDYGLIPRNCDREGAGTT